MSVPLPQATPDLLLDARTRARGLSCVHCGLCLPACPTYTTTHHEADSPRGRIQLMLGLSDGSIRLTEKVSHHLDLCLDCRACETACPSGVVYHELIEETRTRLDARRKPTPTDRLLRWFFFNVMTRPTRLKLALLPARLLQELRLYPFVRRSGLLRLLPEQLQKMERLLPARGPIWPETMPEHPGRDAVDGMLCELGAGVFTTAERPIRVGFFGGCVGSVLFGDVNRKAAELLTACGADVFCPRGQQCCGAIHHHNADHHSAVQLARQNIDAFLPVNGPHADRIVTTIAGCGAMLREYDLLLRDDPAYRDRAREFVSRVRDISELLLELDLPAMRHPIDQTVTYHDACHLAHAQRVTEAPRKLLARIPGLKLAALAESDLCCGAAGTYNLTQPEMATTLGERKLRNIDETGATTCVTGNVGCAMHLAGEAAASGRALTIVHPVELLHRAVFGTDATR